MTITITRKSEIQTALSTLFPVDQLRNVLPSSYRNLMVLDTATNSSAARTAYANLRGQHFERTADTQLVETYQYIHPTAKPTPRSRNRLGNSITGAFTGIKAVISHKDEMIEDMTVPIRIYESTEPPAPATASEVPHPRNSPFPIVPENAIILMCLSFNTLL